MVSNRKEWNKIVNDEKFIEKESLGFKWKLSTTHMSCIDRTIIKGRQWEAKTSKVAREMVSEGQTVIDIGANIGYYTLIFSKIVGDSGKVVAFEPFPVFYDRLMYHLKINNINNVIASKKGLYNKTCKKLIARGFPSAAVLKNIDKNRDYDYSKYYNADFVTLDDWCDENNIENVDLIKMDTDGSEVKIIKGAIKIIERYKPSFLCEFYRDADVLGKLFQDLGYKIYEENYKLIGKNTLRNIAKSSGTRNLICRYQ